MTVVEIIVALFLPPLAVLMKTPRLNGPFWLSVVLWLLGYIPGVIYAIYYVTTEQRFLAVRQATARPLG